MKLSLKRIQFESDVEKVKEIFPRIFKEEMYHIDECIEAFTDSIHGKEIDRQLDYFFLENEEGTIMGLTGIYAKNPDEAWLGWFGVLPEYQHHGIGHFALHQTLELMRALGYETVRLYTDPVADVAAINLYKYVGFIQDSQYDEKTITMKYDLMGHGHYNKMIPDWKGKPYGM